MDSKDLLSQTGKFPFVMVITSIFFLGSFFLVVNVPIITALVGGSKSTNFMDLLSKTVMSFWREAPVNIVSISVFLFGSLLSGIILTPIQKVTAYVFSVLSQPLYQKLRNRSEMKLFLGSESTKSEYIELLAWFFANPEKKLHWEWELYQYYVLWGVFLNIATFAFLTVISLWSSMSFTTVLFAIMLAAFFLAFAVGRSIVMGEVHLYYIKEYRREKQQ